MDEIIVVLTNLPDRDSAMKLAHELVETRVAACVSVLGECRSVYRWKGAVEAAPEVPVIIKTRAARFGELESAIRSLHPYELPEIVAVPVVRGLEDYLRWVADETVPSSG